MAGEADDIDRESNLEIISSSRFGTLTTKELNEELQREEEEENDIGYTLESDMILRAWKRFRVNVEKCNNCKLQKPTTRGGRKECILTAT